MTETDTMTQHTDGRHDFNFISGRWLVSNRRLRQRLQGCTEWESFEAVQDGALLLGGLGNMNDFITQEHGVMGMALRFFNPPSRQWSIYWVGHGDGVLQPPVVGAFSGGVGRFEGADTHEGRPVRLRFLWSDITPRNARWEQAFSEDGGRHWETNWVMRLSRPVRSLVLKAAHTMDHYAHLWLFFLMVLGIIVLPGMDMAFVMASSLTGGRRAGLFAVGGIVAGGVCHVVAGALGLGLLLQVVPGMLNVMLLAGSAYIAWIGGSLMRSTSVFGGLPAIHAPSPWRTFRQAALTCLLNPKAYLFMLAIFPQFLRREYGALWLQAAALGLIIALTQTGVYGSLALAAGSARQWMAERPAAATAMARAVGSMLMLAAAFTAWQGWHQL